MRSSSARIARDKDVELGWTAATFERFAADFAATGRVRIHAALPTPLATALHDHLATELDWWRVLNREDRTWDLGPEAIAKLERDGDGELLEIVHRQARHGFQFLFDAVRVPDFAQDRHARGLLLDRFVEALNGARALDAWRALVGDPGVATVDGQATRYLAGHFLTAHDDAVEGKDRLAAYVLGLTPRWRTEWGGMLQFHGADGDVEQAWLPAFNTLHVFRVPQVHSVSYVAPFAGAPRYSITGWLRGS